MDTAVLVTRVRRATRADSIVKPPSDTDKATRQAFYAAAFPDFWATVEGHPYALYDTHAITDEFAESLRRAAEDAWSIFLRVLPVMRNLKDDELLGIGFPEAALGMVRLPNSDSAPSVFARFDFAVTNEGPKVMELNAETPFSLWESHEIAAAVARHFGYRDPNVRAAATMKESLASLMLPIPRSQRVAVTALNTWREDWFTAAYMARVIEEAASRAVELVPTSDLRIRNGALFCGRDRIDVLFRMYPLEHFCNDKYGHEFRRIVESGALRIINPPSALLLQNKAAQAIITGLYDAGAHFSDREREIIRRYFLRSSMDPLPGRCVRKPVLGREGNSVSIVDGDQLLATSDHSTYRAQPLLYQEIADLPQIMYQHPSRGQEIGYGAYTVFLINGTVTALGLRIGAPITDAWAHMMPLGIRA